MSEHKEIVIENDSKSTYCESCDELVTYNIVLQKVTETLRGRECTYNKKVAYCSVCNREVTVNEIRNRNLFLLYNAYRTENNLVSLDTICEIPKKYNIGKRPLSMLLGWGELTYTRYCDGYVPTLRYSDIIKKIYNSPEYYLEILEGNKDKLSDIAYNKSKSAVIKLIGQNVVNNQNNENQVNELKAQYIITFIKNECEDITSSALQNVLYFLQGFNYAFEGTPMFNEDCDAYERGVLFLFAKKYLDNDGSCKEIQEREVGDCMFNSLELSIINFVVKFFCCYSSETLKRFVRLGTPWKNAMRNVSFNEHSVVPIGKETIQNYFVEIKEAYKMSTPSDIKNYVNKMFEWIQQY